MVTRHPRTRLLLTSWLCVHHRAGSRPRTEQPALLQPDPRAAGERARQGRRRRRAGGGGAGGVQEQAHHGRVPPEPGVRRLRGALPRRGRHRT